MRKIKQLFSLFVTLMPFIAFTQTSLLQDKSGETSILLKDKKSVFVNAGDRSVSASVAFSKPKWFVGSNIKFKSTEGVSNLLDGYKFKPEFDFGLYSGNTIKSSNESLIQYIFYGLKFNITNFNLLNKDSSNTFQDKAFYGGSIYLGYNRFGSVNIFRKDGFASSYLFGFSLDYSLINNLEDLKSVQTYSTYTKDTGSSNTILLTDKKSGFSGDYSNFDAIRINFDAYIFPQIIGGQIGFGGYARSQLSGTSPRTNAGVGFIIGQKNAPTNVVFGILYQFNDLFNQLNKENDFLKRGGINLVAGYSF